MWTSHIYRHLVFVMILRFWLIYHHIIDTGCYKKGISSQIDYTVNFPIKNQYVVLKTAFYFDILLL